MVPNKLVFKWRQLYFENHRLLFSETTRTMPSHVFSLVTYDFRGIQIDLVESRDGLMML